MMAMADVLLFKIEAEADVVLPPASLAHIMALVNVDVMWLAIPPPPSPAVFPLIVTFVNTDGETDLSRSEEHPSELQQLMRISYAVFCLKKKKTIITT